MKVELNNKSITLQSIYIDISRVFVSLKENKANKSYSNTLKY